MYIRLTMDEYEIQQWTGCHTGCHTGWECVCTEATLPEARAQRQCYRANQPAYPVRIVKRRVPRDQEGNNT